MNLRIQVKIMFDDDKATIVTKKIWVKNVTPIDPTHARVHAIILEARA